MNLQDTLKSLSPLLLVAGASYLLVKKPIEVDWDEKDESHIGDEAEWDAESFEAESDAAKLRKYEKTYGKTGAKVRLKLLKRIKKQNIYGTKSGQWSARKSQHLTDEYEKVMKKKGAKPYKSSISSSTSSCSS